MEVEEERRESEDERNLWISQDLIEGWAKQCTTPGPRADRACCMRPQDYLYHILDALFTYCQCI